MPSIEYLIFERRDLTLSFPVPGANIEIFGGRGRLFSFLPSLLHIFDIMDRACLSALNTINDCNLKNINRTELDYI